MIRKSHDYTCNFDLISRNTLVIKHICSEQIQTITVAGKNEIENDQCLVKQTKQ